MKRQKIMSQMKEQDKITAKSLNEMEISNMPNRKFKVIVPKILNRPEKSVEDLSENFDKEKILKQN